MSVKYEVLKNDRERGQRGLGSDGAADEGGDTE